MAQILDERLQDHWSSGLCGAASYNEINVVPCEDADQSRK